VRNDISFPAKDGTTLRGWHFPAPLKPGEANSPIVVMAHGFSGVKGSLVKYAEVFQAAGLAVLLYDHRCFGDSDGMPRQEIDAHLQVSDFRDAITFAQTLPGVDPASVGLWGSSFSGGHVTVLGATDARVKCVVNQVALVSGRSVFKNLFTPKSSKYARQLFAKDRLARLKGEPPIMIPVYSENDEFCALPFPVPSGFIAASEAEDPLWKNEVTLSSLESLASYEPGAYLPYVAPTPMLQVIATNDGLAASEVGLAAFESASQPKKLVTHPGGHFTAYYAYFELSSSVARDWFLEHLRPNSKA
jgi:fermentation-respiration switch protein FrsA (DUF1100 family)